jgi:hypothetical protein
MNDYQEVFGKLEAAIEGIESLKKAACKQYSILIDAVINHHITDQKEIERIMDGLTDFGDYPEFLELYRKLCRHVYDAYPEMVGEHVNLWRVLFMERDEKIEDEE